MGPGLRFGSPRTEDPRTCVVIRRGLYESKRRRETVRFLVEESSGRVRNGGGASKGKYKDERDCRGGDLRPSAITTIGPMRQNRTSLGTYVYYTGQQSEKPESTECTFSLVLPRRN